MKKQFLSILISGFFFSSCASVPAVQGRIRNLAVKGDFNYAAQVISRLDNGAYGKNNRLLEALDRGMIYHYAGQYEKSISAFEQAKRIYEQLYTESLSKIAASWLWNDAALPFTGEDFERAMVNVFQALNFIALEKYDEALVEARNASFTLQALNDRYPLDQRNAYADDAFVRFLMGILYESSPDRPQWNDAFLSYKKALEIYEGAFKQHYSVEAPHLLKENLLSAAAWMGEREAGYYRKKFPDIALLSIDARKQKAEVYVICFRGQIINKVSSGIILPGMDGLLTRISFPRYRTGFKPQRPMTVRASGHEGEETVVSLERVQDLDAIARKNLENRRVRILAKAIARPVTKQFLVEALEDAVADKAGEDAAEVFRYAGNVYLLYSEQADLRSWETLPSEVYMGRLILSPGKYRIFTDKKDFSELSLSAGDKKFMMYWSGY
jgi:hypothetical protein